MNQELYQKDDYFGIVTDENGSLKILNKDNNEYPFEDILKKENQFNQLVSIYNQCGKNLKKKEKQRRRGWLCVGTSVLFSSVVIGSILLTYLNPISVFTLVGLYMFYGFVFYYGLDCKRKEEMNHLYHKIQTSFKDINQLQWDILNMKEKTKYKEISGEDQVNNDHSFFSYYYLDSSFFPETEESKVKIIKL